MESKMQMNIAMKQNHRHREKTCGCQGDWVGGRTGSLGLADINYYL